MDNFLPEELTVEQKLLILDTHKEIKVLEKVLEAKKEAFKAQLANLMGNTKEVKLFENYHLIRIDRVTTTYPLVVLKDLFDEDAFMTMVKPKMAVVKEMAKELLGPEEQNILDQSKEIENVISYHQITTRKPKAEPEEIQKAIEEFWKTKKPTKIFVLNK